VATNRFALANQAVVAADAEQDQQSDNAADDGSDERFVQ